MIKTTNKGFTYLPVSYLHCLNWGGFAVCDLCNTPFEEGYLVFILNSCLCPSCFSDWEFRQSHYPDDDVIQDLAFQEANQTPWYDRHIKKGGIPHDSRMVTPTEGESLYDSQG